MKTFKQFIHESEKPKEYEIISNSHGAHAKITPVKLKENTEHPSVEEHFLPKFKSLADRFAHNNNMDKQIEGLHKTHPHTDKGEFHLNEFTKGSAGLTKDLLRHHTEGEPLVHENLVRDLDTHGFVPAKHKFATYSGVGFDIKNAKPVGKSKEGNLVYHQPTYLSSSIDKHIAKSFAGESALRSKSKNEHILHWHHHEHDPVGIIGIHSEFPNEHEVLIPRTNSTKDRHHIEHIGTDKYNTQFGNTVHVHHVRRIPESEITKDPNEKV